MPTKSVFQFGPLLLASVGLAMIQATFRHPSMTVVAIAFHMSTIVLSSMIVILEPAFVEIVKLPEQRVGQLINPAGMAAYFSFFLGFILTFSSVAASMKHISETADFVCGSIIFSVTILVFIGYSLYYVYHRRSIPLAGNNADGNQA